MPPTLFDETASRETVLAHFSQLGIEADSKIQARLDAYVRLLYDWRTRLNLVSKASLPHLWQRHILDSAQLIPHFRARPGEVILDIGSGAGFPGVVLAIVLAGKTSVLLVEADGRKCRFLEAVVHHCGLKAQVIHSRIEDLSPMQPGVLVGRAVAPLAKLLAWTRRQHHPDLLCLFMKGKTVGGELTASKKYPNMQTIMHPSITHRHGVIVQCTFADHAKRGGTNDRTQ